MRDGRVLVAGALVGLAMVGRRGSRAKQQSDYHFFKRPFWSRHWSVSTAVRQKKKWPNNDYQKLYDKLVMSPGLLTDKKVTDALEALEEHRGHYSGGTWGSEVDTYQLNIKFQVYPDESMPESLLAVMGEEEAYRLLQEKVQWDYDYYVEQIKEERLWIGDLTRMGRQSGWLMVPDDHKFASDLGEAWDERESYLERYTLLGPVYDEAWSEDLVSKYINVLALNDDLVRMKEIVRETQASMRDNFKDPYTWEHEFEHHGLPFPQAQGQANRRRGR